jgi:endogenous inhibitor of DNA gyrase (YacG/DUF329 family)
MIKARCPICEKEMTGQDMADWPEFPFCSHRCRTIDLGRWLGEAYAIACEPAGEGPAEQDDESNLP